MNIDKRIEAILFFKGEAVSIKQLSKILKIREEVVRKSIIELKEVLQDRGIRLISNDNRVMLGTSPEMHGVIESMKKEELIKDLGKASLETLSVILYRGPVRKSEIDYSFEGVNSSTIFEKSF